MTAGNFNYVIRVTDSLGSMAHASSIGTINGLLTLSATPSATNLVGATYSQENTVTGGTPPYTYTVEAGSIPTGTTLSPVGPTTSLITTVSGTPTTAGAYDYTIRVTDNAGLTANASSSGTILNNNLIFITADQYNGNLSGVVGADAICQAEGEKVPSFSTLTFKGLLVTSGRFPCSNSSTPPIYTPGCMGSYSSPDWPLQPGDSYYNPNSTVFNQVNTNGVFDGTQNAFEFVTGAPTPASTYFWNGLQSTLSGSGTPPLDILGWAYVNMSIDSATDYSDFSPENCTDFSSDNVQTNGTAGVTGGVITNTNPPAAPSIWGNYSQQSVPNISTASLYNVWFVTNFFHCSSPLSIICVSVP